ncbi:MAG: hypothetical protein Ct9H300mP28_36050 [Pseudomonadota bacterium]|nr:MAG: hypothetical protein Ct9H300mP28_36050 [Pseudomonadota bacterium]
MILTIHSEKNQECRGGKNTKYPDRGENEQAIQSVTWQRYGRRTRIRVI